MAAEGTAWADRERRGLCLIRSRYMPGNSGGGRATNAVVPVADAVNGLDNGWMCQDTRIRSQPFEQSRNAHTKGIGKNLDRVDRGVCTACFDPRHVCSGEAALVRKCFLIDACGKPQLPDAGSELTLKSWGWRRGWHSPWSSDVL